MCRWTLCAAIGAAILTLGSGSAATAQVVASGIYEKNGDRSDDAFKAIDGATADLPDATRPLARMRLRKSVAVSRIRISTAGSRIGIAYDAKAPIVVWIGEEPITWKLTDILVYQVTAKSDGASIEMKFRGDDGERITRYRSVGQDLLEDTVITGPLLPAPIVYKQVFSRTN